MSHPQRPQAVQQPQGSPPPGPTLDDDGVPVFGSEAPPTYVPFKLVVKPDGQPAYKETFEGHTEADAGAVMGLLAARSQLEQGQAMARLLGGILRNDDGVPAEWQPKRDEQTGLVLPEQDDDGYVLKDDEQRPLYRDAYGDLVTDPMLLDVPLEAGSSRRRFAGIMDADNLRVSFEDLSSVAQWVVTRSGNRPTRRQQPSGTGGKSTKRSPRAARSKPPA